MSVTQIRSQEEWDAHIQALDPATFLIVSFYTVWATPCQQMNAVVQALASEYQSSPPAEKQAKTSWVAVNADELDDVVTEYDVTAVPFLVIQQGGVVKDTVSGSRAASVREAVERVVGPPPAGETSHAPTTSAISNSNSNSNSNGNGNNNNNSAPPPPPPPAPETSEADPAQTKEELFARLRELVSAASIMLFMKGTPSSPQCGFSRQMVAILREHSVKYGFFNILADDEVRQGLKEFADWPTYPQLWIGGELVGGLDIVKEELANDPNFLKEYSVQQQAE